ncbi:olfactory receptor 6B1-like [Hyperolius riggenbachi]|uniref:olfactory receptor 6B1-like n=1 Tax=Hyperolius riggenbachi TaxID=752182 RepID=UPI0035A317A6
MTCNLTRITDFILMGISGSLNLKLAIFLMLSIAYILTIVGNVLIVLLVSGSKKLHSPMYFFLCHLSSLDILLSTNVVPYLLSTLLGTAKTMSLNACFTQYYFNSSSTVSECLLLMAMSYDRYVAICIPLNYIMIMNTKICLHLVVWSWVVGFGLNLTSVMSMYGTDFCGCNIIDHIYCDHAALLDLSCTDTSIMELETSVFSIPIVLLPFMFVMVTYIKIVSAILKITSTSGRRKAFSTCTSHIIVVAAYFGTLVAKYTTPPSGSSLNANKVISFLYIVFTPLLNPAVYTLRNKDILECIHKWFPVKYIGLNNNFRQCRTQKTIT